MVSPSTPGGSISPPLNLTRSIIDKMQATRPPYGPVRARTLGADADFHIRKREGAYDDDLLGGLIPTARVRLEMVGYACKLTNYLRSPPAPSLDTHLVSMLSRMIHGSERIEMQSSGGQEGWAGAIGQATTTKLCRQVFCGGGGGGGGGRAGPGRPLAPRVRRAEGAELMCSKLPNHADAVLGARLDNVRHAQAASYILRRVYLDGEDLSEEIICETHRRLTCGPDVTTTTEQEQQQQQQQQYLSDYNNTRCPPDCSGQYRLNRVPASLAAGRPLVSFPDGDMVSMLMRRIIADLNADLRAAVAGGGWIDPVALAAKYSHAFLCVHPFAYGSGRVGRLVLNVLLIKYGVFVACLGVGDNDKDEEEEEEKGQEKGEGEEGQESSNEEEYLRIVARNASVAEFTGRGDFGVGKEGAFAGYGQMASFTLRHARDGLERLMRLVRGPAWTRGLGGKTNPEAPYMPPGTPYPVARRRRAHAIVGGERAEARCRIARYHSD
ncbi:hypothetical protein GE09DRAFT_1242754 [Coniochaeta sp. 2T2.1]|nr:hypothetical protein GE09DRAFT_1242754 [Coniochaeta sp. 2T2.1]